MARNSRTRKADGGSRLTYDVVLMVLGIAVGVVAVVLYQGAMSGDPEDVTTASLDRGNITYVIGAFSSSTLAI